MMDLTDEQVRNGLTMMLESAKHNGLREPYHLGVHPSYLRQAQRVASLFDEDIVVVDSHDMGREVEC